VKLLLDINVVLDVMLNRQPWAAEAARLLAAVERGVAAGYVAGHTITTAHYVVAKTHGQAAAASAVSDLLRIVDVVAVDRTDFLHALSLGWKDFEDAVQAGSALKIGADFIVTRNEKDFAGAPIPPTRPGAVLSLLSS
jgi:predicted nucleic acid-binding protein